MLFRSHRPCRSQRRHRAPEKTSQRRVRAFRPVRARQSVALGAALHRIRGIVNPQERQRLQLTFARPALRGKIGPDEAEPEGCVGSTVEGENEVWADLPRNPKGWGPFSPFLRRSSLADTRYGSLLAPRTEKNGLPAPVVGKLITASRGLVHSRHTRAESASSTRCR